MKLSNGGTKIVVANKGSWVSIFFQPYCEGDDQVGV